MTGPADGAPPAAGPTPGRAACLFLLGGRPFAVETGQAREVRWFEHCTPVPLGPPHLIGMASLRGEIVPVVDVRRLLGLPPAPAPEPIRALVAEAGGVRVAWPVDDVLGVEPVEEWLAPEGGGTAPLEAGRLRRGGSAVPVLDAARIVNTLAAPGGPAGQEVR